MAEGKSLLRVAFSVFILALICGRALPAPGQAAAAVADGKVRSAQQAFNSAQAKLTTMQQTWNKAQGELGKAQLSHQGASNKLQQTRQIAAQKHGAEAGMSAAISARDTAAHQIKARRSALGTELKNSGAYRDAEKEAEAARKHLGELADDKSLSEVQQQKLASELAGKIRRPTEMRKEAETSDGDIQQATERLQAAGKRITALQPQLKRLIDSDPAVTNAMGEEKQAATNLENARTRARRAEQDFNTAQWNVDRQSQQLQAAMTQRRGRRR